MKNGFAFLSIMASLLGLSATAVTRISTPRATSAIEGFAASATLASLLPQGGTCVNCRPCTFKYPDGSERDGHETTPSGQTTGTGLGNEHACAIGMAGDYCTSSSMHPTIACVGGQAALPPARREQLNALAEQLAAGSSEAYRVLLRDFADQVTIDQENRAMLFRGCSPGTYNGILPIPAGAV